MLGSDPAAAWEHGSARSCGSAARRWMARGMRVRHGNETFLRANPVLDDTFGERPCVECISRVCERRRRNDPKQCDLAPCKALRLPIVSRVERATMALERSMERAHSGRNRHGDSCRTSNRIQTEFDSNSAITFGLFGKCNSIMVRHRNGWQDGRTGTAGQAGDRRLSRYGNDMATAGKARPDRLALATVARQGTPNSHRRNPTLDVARYRSNGTEPRTNP
jgi:hypothetical protein